MRDGVEMQAERWKRNRCRAIASRGTIGGACSTSMPSLSVRNLNLRSGPRWKTGTWCAIVLLLTLFGCVEEKMALPESGGKGGTVVPDAGSGGIPGSGGVLGSGGMPGSGGVLGSGGMPGSGGAPASEGTGGIGGSSGASGATHDAGTEIRDGQCEEMVDADVDSGVGDSSGPDSPERCGNGTIEMGELCDDGNLVGGDGCDINCQPDDNVNTPGDDRVGFVACGETVCRPGDRCCSNTHTCLGAKPYCSIPRDPGDQCDGPEDCSTGVCYETQTGKACIISGGVGIACHIDADCIGHSYGPDLLYTVCFVDPVHFHFSGTCE
jgi:cysteine-rich repeat protein